MTNEERDKTIAQIERIQKNLGSIGETPDYLDFAIEALEQTRWIPCSERFPEEHICDDGYIEPSEYVLICDDLNYFHVSRYWGNRRNKRDYKDWVDADLTTRKIIAWMHLPEPYEEEQ